MERETGIEPATNSLEGCDSTTELLPQKAADSSQFTVDSACRAEGGLATQVQLRTVSCELSAVFEFLELMTRIELVTSPLPRECSTN